MILGMWLVFLPPCLLSGFSHTGFVLSGGSWFLSGRGHHVPAPTWERCRATLQTLLLRLVLPVGGCRSSGWALVLLAFVFLFSWRWGLRVFFFRACGPPGRLSERQLPGVDRNGVFTEAARYIYHLSRVWANGVLDLCDGFRVLKPTGLFTEDVRCDNCEARCTHGAGARTQEPNLPRAADNLHVCGLSLHSLARRSPC